MNNSSILVLAYYIGYFAFSLMSITAMNTRTGPPNLPALYSDPILIGVAVFGFVMIFLEPLYYKYAAINE